MQVDATVSGTARPTTARARLTEVARPFFMNLVALVGIAILNVASRHGLSERMVSLGCIPFTILWFHALEDYANPRHEDRTASTLFAAACAGFVGWLLHGAMS